MLAAIFNLGQVRGEGLLDLSNSIALDLHLVREHMLHVLAIVADLLLLLLRVLLDFQLVHYHLIEPLVFLLLCSTALEGQFLKDLFIILVRPLNALIEAQPPNHLGSLKHFLEVVKLLLKFFLFLVLFKVRDRLVVAAEGSMMFCEGRLRPLLPHYSAVGQIRGYLGAVSLGAAKVRLLRTRFLFAGEE